MVLEEVKKSKFEQINDKWYYFSDDIVSHPYLKDIIDYTEKKNEKIEKYIQFEKKYLLKLEKKAYLKSDRLSLLRKILLQNPKYCQIASQKRNVNQNVNFSQTTRSYILISKIHSITAVDLQTIF